MKLSKLRYFDFLFYIFCILKTLPWKIFFKSEEEFSEAIKELYSPHSTLFYETKKRILYSFLFLFLLFSPVLLLGLLLILI